RIAGRRVGEGGDVVGGRRGEGERRLGGHRRRDDAVVRVAWRDIGEAARQGGGAGGDEVGHRDGNARGELLRAGVAGPAGAGQEGSGEERDDDVQRRRRATGHLGGAGAELHLVLARDEGGPIDDPRKAGGRDDCRGRIHAEGSRLQHQVDEGRTVGAVAVVDVGDV